MRLSYGEACRSGDRRCRRGHHYGFERALLNVAICALVVGQPLDRGSLSHVHHLQAPGLEHVPRLAASQLSTHDRETSTLEGGEMLTIKAAAKFSASGDVAARRHVPHFTGTASEDPRAFQMPPQAQSLEDIPQGLSRKAIALERSLQPSRHAHALHRLEGEVATEDSNMLWPLTEEQVIGFVLLCAVFLVVVSCCVSSVCSWGAKGSVIRGQQAADEGHITWYDRNAVSGSWVLLNLFVWGSMLPRTLRNVSTYFAIFVLCTTTIVLSFELVKETGDGISVAPSPEILRSFVPLDWLLTWVGLSTVLLLGIYLNFVLRRWWEVVIHGIGGMWQEVNSLCLLIACICPEIEHKPHRRALIRYGLLCQSLIYHAARGLDGLQELQDEDMIMGSEITAFQGPMGSRPQSVWVWILDIWTGLHHNNIIDDRTKRQACEHILAGRRAVKSVLDTIGTRPPFGFVHLAAVMVHLSIFLLTLRVAMCVALIVSRGLAEQKMCGSAAAVNSQVAQSTCVRDATALVLEAAAYITFFLAIDGIMLAVLHFASLLQNPLEAEPGACGIPRSVFLSGMLYENKGFYALARKGHGSAPS
eukprot:TRINITY_DN44655_c0_g1_i1.p1 TRINITY_DN44655_c0_g1~~TRINITY_DN44655_c0_g1_i1.p1  ORF type:complete len:588 (-),score=62.92 TRINITY_DN44655_c0_g1_i1:217-1980(-)